MQKKEHPALTVALGEGKTSGDACLLNLLMVLESSREKPVDILSLALPCLSFLCGFSSVEEETE